MTRATYLSVRLCLAVVLAMASATTTAAQQTCIPLAAGVPGLPGAPKWRPDPITNFPTQLKRLNDPRWRGALSQVINGQVEFRALSRDSLYLSWHTKVDQDLGPLYDQVLVGFKQRNTKPAVVFRFTLASNVVGLEAAPRPGVTTDPVSVVGDRWTGTGWQRLGQGAAPPLPTWIDGSLQGTTRGWTFGGPPRWAFQTVIPISTTGLANGLDLDPAGSIEMWYAFLVGNGNSAIPYLWPSTIGFTYVSETTFVFPNPADPWGTLKLNGDPSTCGGNVALDRLNVGTENAVSSQINLTSSNPFFARPENIHATQNVPAHAIDAQFFLANWGSAITDPTFWRPITPAPPPTNDAIIPAGTLAQGTAPRNDIHFTYTVPPGDRCLYDPTCPTPGYPHQCLLVQLSATPAAGGTIVFRNQSVYRNMDFVSASRFQRSAQISVVGLAPLGDGRGDRDVYLYVETFNLPRRGSGEAVGPVVVDGRDTLIVATRDTTLELEWGAVRLTEGDTALVPTRDTIFVSGEQAGDRTAAVRLAAEAGRLTSDEVDANVPTYRVHAYHTTGDSVTIQGVKLPILSPQTSFGYWVDHDGEVVGWRHKIEGARLVRLAPNFYRIEVPDNGAAEVVTTIDAIGYFPFAVSLHAGVSIPHGTLNTSHDPGFGITADLEYWWTPRFAVVALLGYHRFGAAGSGDDLDLLHASGALETRVTSGATSVLLDAGAGFYDLSPGSTEPGVHAGAGLERELSPAVSLGVSGRVHTVFTSGSNTTFTSVQAGGRFKF